MMGRPVRFSFFLWSLMICCSACGPFRMFRGGAEPILDPVSPVYRIRVGDKISLSIRDHADISLGSIHEIYNSSEVYGKWVLVQEDSTIDLPGMHDFKIAGLTLEQAEQVIKQHHSDQIRDPEVTLRVMDLQVTLLGEVKNPGSYVIDRDKADLLEVLGKAGGLNYYAELQSIEIIRQGEEKVHKYAVDLSKFETIEREKIWVYPDDVIYVPSKALQHTEKRLGNAIPFASVITALALILTLL